ncbi:hypothetical protein VOLCADRAFT_99101 [Volvox carteri f. nagariensis]|uniref:Uncharacterized protein n=1 Tax=Volvox carteri f. nagariensis TaxID=3068 RepID=D8UH13_VOLCA|nr:uncharacterized protein VOLCADRAFT_99101 [Volvox carteri f. nagariensis]EFJ40963.1 hypothetical protein VOLCADRAFT_99101 [Volvox carteri f. nagariensis]|eukprot:XP_002957937.1 hypothetical protein VOLCADRAFT_99101 [Volvox carteri f. nagariensis]
MQEIQVQLTIRFLDYPPWKVQGNNTRNLYTAPREWTEYTVVVPKTRNLLHDPLRNFVRALNQPVWASRLIERSDKIPKGVVEEIACFWYNNSVLSPLARGSVKIPGIVALYFPWRIVQKTYRQLYLDFLHQHSTPFHVSFGFFVGAKPGWLIERSDKIHKGVVEEIACFWYNNSVLSPLARGSVKIPGIVALYFPRRIVQKTYRQLYLDFLHQHSTAFHVSFGFFVGAKPGTPDKLQVPSQTQSHAQIGPSARMGSFTDGAACFAGALLHSRCNGPDNISVQMPSKSVGFAVLHNTMFFLASL